MAVFTEEFDNTTYKDASSSTTWSSAAMLPKTIQEDIMINLPEAFAGESIGRHNMGLAQKIIATTDGMISSITVKLYKTGTPTDNLLCRIYYDNNGTPTAWGGMTGQSTTTQSGPSLPTGTGTNVTFLFNDVPVVSGQAYYILIYRDGSTDYSNCYWILFGNNDNYIGETLEYQPAGGGTWGAFSNGDFFLTVRYVHYAYPATAKSLKVNGTTKNIPYATLTANAYTNNGTSIAYYMSANGGTNWESVTSGVKHIFSNTGSDLRWRAVLSGSAIYTPQLNSVSVDYTTADISNPTNVYSDDNVYATCTPDTGLVTVQLSKNGGTSYNSPLSTTFDGTETTVTLGGPGELWGTSWTGADITNTNFRLKLTCGTTAQFYQVYKDFNFTVDTDMYLTGIEVKVTAKFDGTTTSIDHITAKVYYGNSVVGIQEGSLAFISDEQKIALFNGSDWVRILDENDNVGGSTTIVSNEIPGGLVNGSNTVFTTAASFATGTLKVFKNGIRLKGAGNDYTEGTQGFTMTTAPATGTVLLVDYHTVDSTNVTGSTSFVTSELAAGTPNGSLRDFTTASSYVANSTVVFLDGVRMRRGVDYTESADKTINFASAPATGSEILVDYQTALSVTGNADTLDGQHGAYYAKQSDMSLIGLGSWTNYTPTITASSGSITSYTLNFARYTKIGKTVIVNIDLTLNNVGTAAGQLLISTPSSVYGAGGVYSANGFGSEYTALGYTLIIVNSNANRVAVTKYTGGTCLTNTHRFGMTIIYEEA